MPRRSVKTAVEGIEVKRGVQKKKLNEAVSPNEILHKQNIAVFLKVATYTHSEIAAALGERKHTVKTWFKEPRVIALYEESLESITGAARTFLETLSINAVKRLGELVNSSDSKVALDAIREVLDRGGLPKLSRVEKKEDKHETKDDNLTLNFNVRTAEEADRVEALIAEAEGITSDAVSET
jgi:hypothetical protein